MGPMTRVPQLRLAQAAMAFGSTAQERSGRGGPV